MLTNLIHIYFCSSSSSSSLLHPKSFKVLVLFSRSCDWHRHFPFNFPSHLPTPFRFFFLYLQLAITFRLYNSIFDGCWSLLLVWWILMSTLFNLFLWNVSICCTLLAFATFRTNKILPIHFHLIKFKYLEWNSKSLLKF